MQRRTPAIVTAALLGLGAPALAVAGPASAAPSTGPVLSEVYGGGGNSGATYKSDFVELGTRSSSTSSLDGWSVQYLPGSPSATSTWQVTPVSGTVAPGGRYLVAEGKGAGGTTDLPTPDASGSIAMSATSGTVALVHGTQALTCRTAADCAADDRVVDLVGYGGATVREGTPAPAPSNTTSVARAADLADTDDNGADLSTGAPTPTDSAGQTGQPGGGGDAQPARIDQVQGTTRISPLVGRLVGPVPGTVTAVRAFGSARGFWFTDPTPDDDPRTSEGLFVLTGSTTPTVSPGDSVQVTGTVTEYYPGSPSTTPYQSTTELTGATVSTVSTGNPLPAPTVLTPASVPDQEAPMPGGNIEGLPLQPDTYALDYWEAHEGEVVSVADARVVGPTTPYDELYVTTKPDQHRTPRGGTYYPGYDQPNTGVLKVESLISFSVRPFPVANTGDVLSGVTSGPLEYDSYGGYTLQASTLGQLQDNHLRREVTSASGPNRMTVATYNVENLAATDQQAKFDQLAEGIVTNLRTPDVVTLEEVQDNDGATDDGVVAADQTLQRFVDAIVAKGGPRYQWREIDPVDDQDGGQPGGNIRNVFLFDPSRVQFVDRPGGSATAAVGVVTRPESGYTHLTQSPGRIDPTDPAWEDSRKPLVGEFRFARQTVFVIANHFDSKGGDQPVHGRFQPPARPSEQQRVQQARLVKDFADRLSTAHRTANVVVAGDLNDYSFSPALQTLTEGGTLTDLITTLPAPEQYTYVYEGSSQVLDHVLTTSALRHVSLDVVHVNAEFAEQASDHDPQVVRFHPTNGRTAYPVGSSR